MIVRSATAGMAGVDCSTQLSAAAAKALNDSGILFVMRYLPLSENPLNDDLAPPERDAILDAGLGLGLVQHVRRSPWTPTAALGKADGLAAVAQLAVLEWPAGASVFYDLEGCAAGTTAGCIAYDKAWTDVVAASGYVCGAYVGFDVPLTSQQLRELRVTRYWQAGNGPAEPTDIGYCMLQKMPFDQVIGGVKVDRDQVTGDHLGRFPELVFGAPEDDDLIAAL